MGRAGQGRAGQGRARGRVGRTLFCLTQGVGPGGSGGSGSGGRASTAWLAKLSGELSALRRR